MAEGQVGLNETTSNQGRITFQTMSLVGLAIVALILAGCAAPVQETLGAPPFGVAPSDVTGPLATFTPVPTAAAPTSVEPTLGVGTPSAPTPIGAPDGSESETPEELTLSPEPEATVAESTGAASAGSNLLTDSTLPAIYAFGISDTEVEPGERITLMWDARGESAAICPRTYLGTIDSRCFDAPLTGAQQATFNVDPQVWDYVGFDLHIVYDGREVTQFAPIRITCQGGGQWWFFRSAPYTQHIPAQCPISYPTESAGAAQNFEHGTMLWLASSGQVIVLFEDGRYQTFNSLSAESEAQSDGAAPPPGYYEPIRGFGVLWDGQAPGSAGLRDALGWAVEPETNITTAYQCYVENDALTCFVRGEGASVIQLNPDGTWVLWPTG